MFPSNFKTLLLLATQTIENKNWKWATTSAATFAALSLTTDDVRTKVKSYTFRGFPSIVAPPWRECVGSDVCSFRGLFDAKICPAKHKWNSVPLEQNAPYDIWKTIETANLQVPVTALSFYSLSKYPRIWNDRSFEVFSRTYFGGGVIGCQVRFKYVNWIVLAVAFF